MAPPDVLTVMALNSAAAGAVALAFGGAPLGVLMIARRLSLMGDALSHGILPGVAIAFLVAGRDPVALTVGALTAGLIVAGLFGVEFPGCRRQTFHWQKQGADTSFLS